ncbi:MAG TPA: DUF2075 domain-containing protein [Streptosporangiaceae bacterium]|nr:DUF2075 domain-containing protein [Streptosporangiaceae bacterium]
MLLRHSAAGLAEIAGSGSVAEAMLEQMLIKHGQRASPGEVKSWRRSLPLLAQDLVQAGLGDVEVLVEYRLPLTSRRADAIIAGRHPGTGAPSYVVVELKQWSRAELFEDDPATVLVDGYGHSPRLHPLEQVRGYCEYLADYVRTLRDQPDALAGVAYLHNAAERDVAPLRRLTESGRVRLFTGERRSDFTSYLLSRLAPGVKGAPYADMLLGSLVAPSTQLLAVAAAEIREREQFVLLDEQRLAFNLVMHAVEAARAGDSKTVIIVSGGPGTGKSVIALSLLGELARRGRTVLHATGSRSFTQTLRKVAGKGSTRVQSLFKYFNQFTDADRNGLDVLILDEAHRIRETSAGRYTPARFRSGKPQIDELMAAARVPVFLLDENQVVRPGELGTVRDIQAHAQSRNLRVERICLDSYFRCGGSEEYLDWVDRLLGLEPGGPIPWCGDPAFDVRIAASPHELEEMLERRLEAGYGARMAAGFCWPWSDPRADGSLVPDVVIGDWARPWNLRGERALGGAPPAALWATDPAGFGQVGCVYTAQGFEYDWSGVIIGPDFVWRGDRWVAVRSANKDPDFRSLVRASDEQFDRLVRNVYKVLLTRGMIGTVIYSDDPETRVMLRSLAGAVTTGVAKAAGGSGRR